MHLMILMMKMIRSILNDIIQRGVHREISKRENQSMTFKISSNTNMLKRALLFSAIATIATLMMYVRHKKKRTNVAITDDTYVTVTETNNDYVEEEAIRSSDLFVNQGVISDDVEEEAIRFSDPFAKLNDSDAFDNVNLDTRVVESTTGFVLVSDAALLRMNRCS